MSTEWFLQAFENKKEQNILIEDVLKILSEYNIEKREHENCIILTLHDNEDIDIYFDLTESTTSHLMVSRPLCHDDLYHVLFKIMKLGNFMLYAADASYTIILNEHIEKDFPDDMIEALGKPKVAENEKAFSILLHQIYGT
jgi:hypothetical protein